MSFKEYASKEYLEERLSSFKGGGGTVKSVNSIEPDENGNINVLGWEEGGYYYFDGNLDNALEVADIGNDHKIVKISTDAPELEDWVGGYILLEANEEEYKFDINQDTIDQIIQSENGYSFEIFTVAKADSVNIGGITVPTKGIWITLSSEDIEVSATFTLYCPGQTIVHKINPKFLPEGIGYEQEATFTFDGDLSKVEYIETNGVYYIKCSNQIPKPEDWLGGSFEMTDQEGNSTIIIDQTFFDSNFQDLESYYGFMGVIVARTNFSPMDGLSFTSGIWVLYAPEMPLIVNKVVCPGLFFIHKIDAKYLPEGVGYEYTELKEETVEISWDGVTTDGYEYITPQQGSTLVKLFDGVPAKEGWIGKTIIEYYDGELHETVITEDNITVGTSPINYYYIGHRHTIMVCLEPFAQLGIAAGVWAQALSDTSTNELTDYFVSASFDAEVESTVVHKIDEKFIPNTIARVSDVSAPKTEFILVSSTEGSTKQFKITVNDAGVITATEIV